MLNLRAVLPLLFVGVLAGAAFGDTKPAAPVAQVPPVNISTGPISEGSYISPGTYVATVAPTLNEEMAVRLKKALAQVPGLTNTNSSSTDSTVHFTVKEGVKLRVADIQAVVAKTDTGAVVTTPMLAHSTTPKPGI